MNNKDWLLASVCPDPKLFFVLEDMYAKNMYLQKVI